MSEIKGYDLDALFADTKDSDTYLLESAKIDFTEEIYKCMKDKKLSRKALADKLGSSPAYVTKILRGNANFTLESMVKIAKAIGCELRCHVSTWPKRQSPRNEGFFCAMKSFFN